MHHDIFDCVQNGRKFNKDLKCLKAYDFEKALILSNEHFSWFDQNEIHILKTGLDRALGGNDAIRYYIVVYFRPQFELAISRFSTALRVGEIAPPIIPGDNFRLQNYDYSRLLRLWSRAFNSSSLVPRDYLRLHKNDIAADFCKVVGIDYAKCERIRRLNRSLNRDAQSFLLAFNRAAQRAGGVPSSARQHLTDYLDDNHADRGLRPRRSAVKSFMLRYAAGNERLNQQWFRGQAKFTKVDLRKFPDSADAANLSIDKVMDIFVQIFSRFHVAAVDRESYLKQLSTALAVREETAVGLNSALKTQETHILSLETANRELLGQARSMDAAIKDISSHVESLQKALDIRAAEVSSLHEALAIQAQTEADLNDALKAQETYVYNLEGANRELLAQARGMDAAIKDISSHVESLQKALDTRAAEVSSLHGALAIRKQTEADLNDALKAQGTYVSNLENANRELLAQARGMDAAIKDISSHVKSLQKALDIRATEVSSLQEALAIREQPQADFNDALKVQENHILNLGGANQELAAQARNMDTTIKDINSHVEFFTEGARSSSGRGFLVA